MVEFLLNECKKIPFKEAQPGGGKKIYNLQDCHGNMPVFTTDSSKIVELMLSFDDLVKKNKEGRPLLHHCASRMTVTEKIALMLCDQLGLKDKEKLPLEVGQTIFLLYRIFNNVIPI